MQLSVNTEAIIKKYYVPGSLAHDLLLVHSKAVMKLAFKIAKRNPHLNINIPLITQAAMLHDIGVFKTNAPELGCFGSFPYICHGFLGREILENEGLHVISLFCERHTGTGLSKEEIIEKKLPVPARDMLPVTIEEKLICYADKFFSKSSKYPDRPKKPAKILKNLSKYGCRKLDDFNAFVDLFGINYIYDDDVY